KFYFFFFQAEDGIRDFHVTGVQTCALPIWKVTNGKLIEKKSEKLKKYINKHLPHYDFTIDFSWAGTFGETKDGNPYIGEHKDFPNSLFVLGFGGNGITFSVIGMDIVSKLLKNQTHELVDIYRFGR